MIDPVTAENLIGAFARHYYLDMLSGNVRHKIQRNRRRIGQRLVQIILKFRQDFPIFLGINDLVIALDPDFLG